MSRRTRFAPIRPSPTMPSCMGVSVVMSALLSLQRPVATDECVGRGVVAEFGLGGALQFREDRHRERLAEFDAPLVERVDAPDGFLREHTVLVERDERAEGV